MLRTLDVYLAYFVQFLKARMEYKADFIASIVANVVVTFSGLLFILFLMSGESVNSLHGWSKHEVLFIYGYSMIAMAIFNTFAPNLYRFGDKYIIEGQFDRVLLRPLSSLFQVLFESFNLESIGSLLLGAGLILYTAGTLEITLDAAALCWLALSGVSGGVILLSVFIVLASLSFHFQDRLGIGAPVYSLITFGRYPLPIFNNVIQFILRWVVPFGFVAFYPATYFFDREGFELYCYLTPVMALVCAAVAGAAWRLGVSRYSSTGN